MFSRAENTIQILKNMGINISHKIIWGRSHNNRSGIGVNELGDRFINDTYNSTIENYNVNLGRTRQYTKKGKDVENYFDKFSPF